MAKKAQDAAQEAPDELEEVKVIEEARKTTGRTPQDIRVMIREFTKMLEAVKLSDAGEIGIGTYFIPFEGQPGIEGLVHRAAAYMNDWVQKGWRPWQMANPYPGEYAFELETGPTGALKGQWVTIIWLRPVEA